MSGPPPTPPHLRLLHGNPQPQMAADMPEPPSFLSSYAMNQWWAIGPELHRLGLLTAMDVMAFASYCAAYARWQEAEEILARVAAGDDAMHGLLIKRENSVGVNPLVVVSRKAAEEMMRAAIELGLTPASRTRAAGIGGPPDGCGKFSGLLGGA